MTSFLQSANSWDSADGGGTSCIAKCAYKHFAKLNYRARSAGNGASAAVLHNCQSIQTTTGIELRANWWPNANQFNCVHERTTDIWRKLGQRLNASAVCDRDSVFNIRRYFAMTRESHQSRFHENCGQIETIVWQCCHRLYRGFLAFQCVWALCC